MLILKSTIECHITSLDAAIREVQRLPVSHSGIYALVYTQQAEGHHLIDFETFPLTNKSFLGLCPGTIHRLMPAPGAQGYILSFSEDFLQLTGFRASDPVLRMLFPILGASSPLPADYALEQAALPIMQAIAKVQQHDKTAQKELIGGYLRALLHILQQHFAWEEVGSGQHRDRVWNFLKLLQQHIRKEHRVGFYAKALGISPGYLNKAVQAVHRKSAKTLIGEKLLLEAKRDVFLRNWTLRETAGKLGFYDPAHFSKFFKEGTGHTFSTFRKTMRVAYGVQ